MRLNLLAFVCGSTSNPHPRRLSDVTRKSVEHQTEVSEDLLASTDSSSESTETTKPKKKKKMTPRPKLADLRSKSSEFSGEMDNNHPAKTPPKPSPEAPPDSYSAYGSYGGGSDPSPSFTFSMSEGDTLSGQVYLHDAGGPAGLESSGSLSSVGPEVSGG
jgi:hypothetical protein